jgi:hypothetical protein
MPVSPFLHKNIAVVGVRSVSNSTVPTDDLSGPNVETSWYGKASFLSETGLWCFGYLNKAIFSAPAYVPTRTRLCLYNMHPNPAHDLIFLSPSPKGSKYTIFLLTFQMQLSY